MKLGNAARRYLNVPFRHRGRSERYLDCAGLVVIAYRDCGVELRDFQKYGREPHNDGLLKHAIAAVGEPVLTAPVRLADLRPDDIVLMRFRVNPHHLAIVGEHSYGKHKVLTIIHADGEADRVPGEEKNGRVLEQRLSPDIAERITHVFRRPV